MQLCNSWCNFCSHWLNVGISFFFWQEPGLCIFINCEKINTRWHTTIVECVSTSIIWFYWILKYCYSLKTWCTADFLLLNDILEPCAAVQGWFVTLLGKFYSQMTLLNQFDLFFQIVNSRNASSDVFVKFSAASVSGVGSWILMPTSWPSLTTFMAFISYTYWFISFILSLIPFLRLGALLGAAVLAYRTVLEWPCILPCCPTH